MKPWLIALCIFACGAAFGVYAGQSTCARAASPFIAPMLKAPAKMA